MNAFPKPHQLSRYRIKVRGRLDQSWSDWFEGMAITVGNVDGCTITTMTGFIPDQPALHSLLVRVRDLGLVLLLVERLD